MHTHTHTRTQPFYSPLGFCNTNASAKKLPFHVGDLAPHLIHGTLAHPIHHSKWRVNCFRDHGHDQQMDRLTDKACTNSRYCCIADAAMWLIILMLIMNLLNNINGELFENKWMCTVYMLCIILSYSVYLTSLASVAFVYESTNCWV